MKTIVFYKSISGFTEKYANMIAEELNCPVLKIENISTIDLSSYDTIVFGGSLHAVGIIGLEEFKKYLSKISGRIFIFAVGASPAKEGIIEEIWNNNNLDELGKERTKLFFLRGGFNYKKLNFKNKIIMGLLYFKLKYKKDRNDDENGMLKAYKTPVDFTSKENIKEMIDCIRSNK
ncbi:MAG: flavodoxin domain-containing protein [Spirochaetes bacterium]|nr:flavodoxin domain-containing protein [Spirochaetota bacterium]